MEFLASCKHDIGRYLSDYLKKQEAVVSQVNPLGPQALEKLLEYTLRGKMIRGSLVYLGNELLGGKADPENLTAAGAALELFQSALLIHDDIMDRDMERRGRPSIHAQYDAKLSKAGIEEHYHIAEALGICAGDISFFLGFDIVNHLAADSDKRLEILSLFCREMAIVGTAQMQDVLFSARTELPESDAIHQLYRHKTGRYTFSLPLLTGALLANGSKAEMLFLEKSGMEMGVLFQIRDDELGLFGDPQETGKPAGSDILEGKKTVYIQRLWSKLNTDKRNWLQEVLESAPKRQQALPAILELIEKMDIRKEIAGEQQQRYSKLVTDIKGFPLQSERARKILLELVLFLKDRST